MHLMPFKAVQVGEDKAERLYVIKSRGSETQSVKKKKKAYLAAHKEKHAMAPFSISLVHLPWTQCHIVFKKERIQE